MVMAVGNQSYQSDRFVTTDQACKNCRYYGPMSATERVVRSGIWWNGSPRHMLQVGREQRQGLLCCPACYKQQKLTAKSWRTVERFEPQDQGIAEMRRALADFIAEYGKPRQARALWSMGMRR